jgi:hypothetical protein
MTGKTENSPRMEKGWRGYRAGPFVFNRRAENPATLAELSDGQAVEA